MKWQPINTAPRDGTRILVYGDDGVYAAAWEESEMTLSGRKAWVILCYIVDEWNYYEVVDDVTHWMPLPNPPE